MVQDNAGNKQTITRTIEGLISPAGTLQFSTTPLTIAENSGTTQLAVQRSEGDEGSVDVRYSITGGSAIEGTDYTLATGTLSWPNGDTESKSIALEIIDDNEVEANESIITLSATTNGATLGVKDTITIDDNDVAPKSSDDDGGGGGSLSTVFILFLFCLLALRARRETATLTKQQLSGDHRQIDHH